MEPTQFSVPLRDLDRGDTRRQWAIPSSWLSEALQNTEAEAGEAPGTLDVYLKKNGRQVLVKGNAQVQLTMPCSRSMEPVAVEIDAPILLLLSRKPQAAKAGGKRRSESVDEVLSAEMAAEDVFEGETIVLDAFVREHILLELPMFPVRSDLPSERSAATDTPAEGPGSSDEPRPLDPRLAPLAEIASQMQRTTKE